MEKENSINKSKPEKSEISERERERELEELSEKALEIFNENLKKYPKFSEEEAKRIAEKWGFDKIGISKIVRETDEICFQVGSAKEELEKDRFELGILDPNYQDNKEFGIYSHARIKFCVEKELGVKIDWRKQFVFSLKGILCEDEKGLRYLICGSSDKSNEDFIKWQIQECSEFSEKLKEMLKRYNIAELFSGDLKHDEELSKRVLNTQLSVSEEARDAYFKERREQRRKQHTGD